jgi:alpha-tubulin suppressor-like RCC1 family protein
MGSNSDGKLGIGEISLSYSNVPCLVEELEDIVKVSCGVAHTLAIDKSGKVFTWG